MKQLYPLSGIITVLNTPFDHSDQIVYKALERNVEEALAAGVSGFLVPAMASEVPKLNLTEKLKLVETVINTVNGQVPVFVGTASGSISESSAIIKAYQNLGCRHYLIQLPFVTDAQFKADFYSLVDLGPEIVMLQDWSQSTYGLSDELIVELFENVPAFRCLKVETVPAGAKYSKILELTQGTLNVSGGWAVMQMPEALHRGVHAFMPTAMHWIYSKIFKLYQRGDHREAIQLFDEILPILAFSNQHLDISIHFFKRLLWKQGIYPTPAVRSPIASFDHDHQHIADELIDKVIKIENRIKQE